MVTATPYLLSTRDAHFTFSPLNVANFLSHRADWHGLLVGNCGGSGDKSVDGFSGRITPTRYDGRLQADTTNTFRMPSPDGRAIGLIWKELGGVGQREQGFAICVRECAAAFNRCPSPLLTLRWGRFHSTAPLRPVHVHSGLATVLVQLLHKDSDKFVDHWYGYFCRHGLLSRFHRVLKQSFQRTRIAASLHDLPQDRCGLKALRWHFPNPGLHVFATLAAFSLGTAPGSIITEGHAKVVPAPVSACWVHSPTGERLEPGH